jgi:hypothetical protein
MSIGDVLAITGYPKAPPMPPPRRQTGHAGMSPMLSHDLFAELKRFIDFPPYVVSATIRLGVDSIPEVDCMFHPCREIEVTSLSSIAREFALDHSGPLITKRYRLEEIDELGAPAQQDG